MNKNLKTFAKGKAGFTIIELIVVIAIIAILAAIVMVNVVQYINKSKDAAALADLQQVDTAATVYAADPTNTSGYSGFCNSATSQSLGAAIHALGSSYHYDCYDSTTTYTVYNSDSWIPYAMASSYCGGDNGKFIAYVQNGSLYSCSSAGGLKSSSAGGGTTGGSVTTWSSTVPSTTTCDCN